MNETLAANSNYALYFAMAVFTVAMVSYAVDLAGFAPRAGTAEESPARQLVGAGSGGAAVGPRADVRVGDGRTADRPAGGGADDAPRRRPAAGIALALTWLGTLVLSASVVLRGLSVMRPPWGNMFEFATTGSLAVGLAFCLLSLRRDVRWLGLFVVGPVLLTLGLAITVFYTEASQLMPSLKSVWLVIHVSVAILSVALFTIGFSVTILYLVKSWLEASTGPLSRTRASMHAALPSARALDRTAYGLHVAAFPMWTFTLIAGAIWAEQAWGHYWNWDPKEVWTFVIWVVYAAYLHARATTGWSARSASYIALAGYGCILVNYMVVNVYFVGQHSYSGM
jgi:cytochrome c-type biogenesis protein CcsB